MRTFPSLFQTGQLGPVQTSNRLVMPAMDQNLCDDNGLLTEANIDHYEQRALGGVGTLIVETSAVSYPQGAASRHQPALSSDDCIPGLRRLGERCHPHGSRVFVQICHHGKTGLVDTVEGRPLTVPSDPLPAQDYGGLIKDMTMAEIMKMAGRMAGSTPSYHQATADDLAEIVDDFASAAARVQQAGLDGVELHAAHGYLVSSFLSPHWNSRTDEYGGSVEGRTRLLREIVAAIREQCGAEFGIIVRLDGNEFGIEGGITPSLAAQHAVAATDAGADAIHVSAMGAPDSGVSFTDGPLPWQPDQYRQLTATIRNAVDVPVIAVGRISPESAEEMISAGEADFVAMGRQLLADPDTAIRLRDGRRDLMRPCINCFVCVAENFWDATPRCAVNARLGRPDAPAALLVDNARHVAIVGGGPAGMEAARIAAQRGHRVTVLERASTLGGTARFSAVTTPVNGTLVSYLEAAVANEDIDVRLSTEATPEVLRSLAPDVVLVATGASRRRPDLPGADLDHVLTGDDLRDLLVGGASSDRDARTALSAWQRPLVKAGQKLGLTAPDRIRELSRRWMPIGKNVVIIGGGLVGVEIAEFLAERDRTVTVVEASANVGVEMAHPRRWRALHQARSHGVTFVTNATVTEITTDDVLWTDGQDESGEAARTQADNVIVAAEVHPDTRLASELEAAGFDITVIGDASSVGYIEGAIRTGHDAGATI